MIVGKSRPCAEQLLASEEKPGSGIVQDLACSFELVFKKNSSVLKSSWQKLGTATIGL